MTVDNANIASAASAATLIHTVVAERLVDAVLDDGGRAHDRAAVASCA
jgi:hypothetical protein